MTLRLSVALSVALVLAPPGVATAAPDVDRAMSDARAYWAAYGYTPHYAAATFDGIRETGPCAPSWRWGERPAGIAASADRGDCTIEVAPLVASYTQYQSCSLMVHELGHLVGIQHDDPRFPVMAHDETGWDAPIKRCSPTLAAKGGRLIDADLANTHRFKQRLHQKGRRIHVRRQLTRIMPVRSPNDPARH